MPAFELPLINIDSAVTVRICILFTCSRFFVFFLHLTTLSPEYIDHPSPSDDQSARYRRIPAMLLPCVFQSVRSLRGWATEESA